MRDRSHVGDLRPSQLMHTYGVGATVELPELTTLVLGLDDWPRQLGKAVSEPRLLAAVRAALGPQVEQLLTPPVVPDGDSSGVPVSAFPRWLRCPVCSRLAPIDSGVFTLREEPWRPERTRYVHDRCPRTKSSRPPTAFPARYLMACQNGHIDDFPWVEFLHGPVACRGTLKLRELGTGGRPGDVQLECDECGRRRLSQAFGQDAKPFLPPRCRGRHPHLAVAESCDQEPVTLLLGASNAWFPVISSALAIPSAAGELAQVIDEAWAILALAPAGEQVLDFALTTNPELRRLRALRDRLGLQVVSAAVDSRRSGQEGDADVADLLTPEWRVLTASDEAPEQPDFKLRPVGPPVALAELIADVVLVERLREVSALRGFTRLSAPDELGSGGGRIVPLAREAPRWLPCSEVRGEGIFIRFDEDRVLAWEHGYRSAGLATLLHDGHRAWRERRGLDPDQSWLGERYVLLHSFAHALIRELALECGYTASSIRERIYATVPGLERTGAEPMAGVLLYTAAPDSEGTLGGLVSLGEPDQLGPLVRHALERAQLCSSDPLCSEHDPLIDGSVHLAACHACQFASETSCERGNRFLDRVALVRTLADRDAGGYSAYFSSLYA